MRHLGATLEGAARGGVRLPGAAGGADRPVEGDQHAAAPQLGRGGGQHRLLDVAGAVRGRAVGRLLGARGRVLPMAAVPLDIEAVVEGIDPTEPAELTTVRGQVAVASTPGRVVGVRLLPEHPPACEPAVAAVRAADWTVLGPGSWFTSVLPHLLVPDLAEALTVTRARRLLVLNLEMVTTETAGFSAIHHLESLTRYAPGMRLDAVLADPCVVDDHHGLAQACDALGATLHVHPVARSAAPTRPASGPSRAATRLASGRCPRPVKE